MNSREKNLLILLVVFLGGWQGWKFFDSALLEPVRKRDQEIRNIGDAIDDKQLQERRIENLSEELTNWKKSSLPPDPVVSSAVYQKWVIELAAQCQLIDVAVNPTLALNQRPVADTYTPIVLRVNAKGTFDQISEFLDRIRNTGLVQRVAGVSLSDPSKENPPKLALNMQLEGLSFVGTDDRKTLFPDPQPSDPSPRSQNFQEQLAVLKKQLIFGEPAPVVIDDPAQHLVLSATFPAAEKPAAWFLEKRQNQKQVVFKGNDFQLAGVTGKVVDVGNDFVELEIGDKKSKLKIGKPLKDVASGNPTPGGPGGGPPSGMRPPGFGGPGGGRGRRGGGMRDFDFNSLTPEQQQQFRERMEQFRNRRRGGDEDRGGDDDRARDGASEAAPAQAAPVESAPAAATPSGG